MIKYLSCVVMLLFFSACATVKPIQKEETKKEPTYSKSRVVGEQIDTIVGADIIKVKEDVLNSIKGQ